ncbi:MAG TPA: translation initiation factor IF-2 [Gemmatales bacterium]|nr:translation initiation factor IF-2 [Gemmatales bacterium]
MKEAKVRIYQLAKDLDVDTNILLEICTDAGFDKVRSQLSSVDNDQIEIIKVALKKRFAPPPPATPPPPPVLRPPVVARPPTLSPKPPVASAHRPIVHDEPVEEEPITPPEVARAQEPAPAKTLLPTDFKSRILNLNAPRSQRTKPATPVTPPVAPATPPTVVAPTVVDEAPAAKPPVSPSKPTAVQPTEPKPIGTPRPLQANVTAKPPNMSPAGGVTSNTPPGERRSALDRARPTSAYQPPNAQARRKIVMPGNAPAAPSSQPGVLKPTVKFTPDMLVGINTTKGPVTAKDIIRKIEEKHLEDKAKARRDTGDEPLADDDGDMLRPGLVKGREERHKKRSIRAKAREDDIRKLTELLDDDDDTPSPKHLHRLNRQRQRQGTLPRKGTVVDVQTPITIRSLSENLGVKAADLIKKLMAREMNVTINTGLDEVTAEELAIELGIEIKIVKEKEAEELVLAEFDKKTADEALIHRAPIVTVMGHVDHGKTSLLDRIRESNVVASEAGGITQHIRAWRVNHSGKDITFLDTPGHAAFTQMRARGANVTDIVVLVVAADDGIMPQTDEAISHAKAAGVPIIVAINKVDLPNANMNRTRQQLYSKELIPDDMGGDTPFIETVATKDRARGINELLDMILLVAELKDLKADPARAATGTCLEARVNGDEGVVANFLVQDGTLRRGDIILCGKTFGRARQMFSDQGEPIEEAGPSMPVRLIGLEQAPDASDKFYVVDDIAQAREIAESRIQKHRDTISAKHATFRLEDLGKAKATEVKIILKADVKGSIEAIKKDIEKLVHDEVKIKVLHAAVGGITESDVQLALASPEDTLIIGFNVVPDDEARRMADAQGIEMKLYDIIYKLSDDLKLALEGKLKPKEEVIHLGRAVVRDTFKISRVGTVAGCHVTSGVIERSAKIRLIRDGVVIYPPPERHATLDSLKRHKDDVREVREGYECGIKIVGFDDVKTGDVIEAFKVEQVQRTL